MIELLVEIVFQLFGEILVELVGKALKSNRRWHPVTATIGWLLFGALIGGLVFWFYPRPIVPPSGIPGLGVLVSTVVGAVGMALWGRFWRRRGRSSTQLATWYGGGAFALGASLVRTLGLTL